MMNNRTEMSETHGARPIPATSTSCSRMNPSLQPSSVAVCIPRPANAHTRKILLKKAAAANGTKLSSPAQATQAQAQRRISVPTNHVKIVYKMPGTSASVNNINKSRSVAVNAIPKAGPQQSPLKTITIKSEPIEKTASNNNIVTMLTIKPEPIEQATTNNNIVITSTPKVFAVRRQILSKINEPQSQSTAAVSRATHPPSTAEYRELFAALLKIKDAPLVARVMAAINVGAGHNPTQSSSMLCTRCARPLNDMRKSAATQTVEVMTDWRHRLGTMSRLPTPKQTRKRRHRTPHAVKQTDEGAGTEAMTDTSESLSSLPAKRAHVVQMRPLATPVVPQPVNPLLPSALTTPAASSESLINNNRISDAHTSTASTSPPTSSNEVRLSVDSISSSQLFDNVPLSDIDFSASVQQLMADWDRSERSVVDRVKAKMAQEYRTLKCFDTESGLLPIHVAALNGELHRVMRLVKILKFLKIDLNDLIARDVDEHGDILQNTVLHCAVDSLAPTAVAIVEHLLANGADPLLLNRHDDTVLHYAVKNTDNVALFRALLVHLEGRGCATALAAIGACNQDGLAVIHLIVSQRKVDFLEALLATIDHCLTGVAVPVVASLSVAELRDHIDRFDRLPLAANGGWLPRMWPAKSALLNQPERCTGRTALLRALLQRDSERIVLLLLAHHADPRVHDFAGVNCVSDACIGDGDDGGSATTVAEGRNSNGTTPTPLGVCIQKAIVMLQYMDGSRKARSLRVSAAAPVVQMKMPVEPADERPPKRAYKRRMMRK